MSDMTDWNFQIYVRTSVTDEELEIGLALWTELNYLDNWQDCCTWT